MLHQQLCSSDMLLDICIYLAYNSMQSQEFLKETLSTTMSVNHHCATSWKQRENELVVLGRQPLKHIAIVRESLMINTSS